MFNSKIDIRDSFFQEIYNFAKKDKDVIFITDDLDAWILKKFKKDLPKQFINIGVAEQNMVDVAAGLATCGKRVFTYGICTYITMRCFEQIKFAVCSMNLPVIFIGVGAGFSFGFDGSTHHGIGDIAIMRTLPGMTIYNPSDAQSAASCAKFAYTAKNPVYVRLDKGTFPVFYKKQDDLGDGFKILRKLRDVNVISTGYMTQKAIKAATILATRGFEVGVVDMFRIKPISKSFISKIIKFSKKIITLEENSIVGGIGSIISEIISDSGVNVKLKRLAVLDRQFSIFGSREWLLSINNLDMESIVKNIFQN